MMAYTNFIAAIDLGTSHIAGMIATKNAEGALSIIAYESVSSSKCIRRGCIYNVDEAAHLIKGLIQKLNNRIPGGRIEKVYVGVGGQSIRSMEHIVTKSVGMEGVVSEEIIRGMEKECRDYKPEMLDVLEVVSPTYYLDKKRENNPVGISCNRIEARYKLIVGRPSIRRNIITSIRERAKVDIAGIYVSPLTLADAVLYDSEKDLGCVLVSFGAGVTSVSVYKYNALVSLCVIPLGGGLVTRDIMSLNIVEAEAERLKRAYGSVIIDKDDDSSISCNTGESVGGTRQIKLNELNSVVEARVQEIVENVYARVEETGLLDSLGAGIVITGGASAIKNLDIILKEKFQKDIRIATLKKGLVEKAMQTIADPDYADIGQLQKGNINCAYIPPAPVEKPEEKKPEPEPEEKEETTSDRIAGDPHPRSPFEKFFAKVSGKAATLFDDEEMGTIQKGNKKNR